MVLTNEIWRASLPIVGDANLGLRVFPLHYFLLLLELIDFLVKNLINMLQNALICGPFICELWLVY